MCKDDVELFMEGGHGSKMRTCVFGKHVPVPRDGWVNKGSWSAPVNVDRKIDGHL
jgi:hypothetical protein